MADDAVSRMQVVGLLHGYLAAVWPAEDSYSRLEAALLQGIVRQVEALPAWNGRSSRPAQASG